MGELLYDQIQQVIFVQSGYLDGQLKLIDEDFTSIIAKIVNKKRKELGLRLTVESTEGSVFNINAVMDRQFDEFRKADHANWHVPGLDNQYDA